MLRDTGGVPSSSTFERAEAALQAVPRARFLPPDQVAHADQDVPLPIGHGQTGSQPTTVRRMLELLDVQAGDRVLDVGAGSGWSTALLAWLTGPTGVVHGVERLPELLALASGHLARAGMPWTHLNLAAPGVLGLPPWRPSTGCSCPPSRPGSRRPWSTSWRRAGSSSDRSRGAC